MDDKILGLLKNVKGNGKTLVMTVGDLEEYKENVCSDFLEGVQKECCNLLKNIKECIQYVDVELLFMYLGICIIVGIFVECILGIGSKHPILSTVAIFTAVAYVMLSMICIKEAVVLCIISRYLSKISKLSCDELLARSEEITDNHFIMCHSSYQFRFISKLVKQLEEEPYFGRVDYKHGDDFLKLIGKDGETEYIAENVVEIHKVKKHTFDKVKSCLVCDTKSGRNFFFYEG